MLKASDVKGLVPEKYDCNRHLSATDRPKGKEYCISCLSVESFNEAIDRTSSKELYLDRVTLCERIWESLSTHVGFYPVNADKCFKAADAIIQSFNAGQLLRVKE